jgi:hypothetical protein
VQDAASTELMSGVYGGLARGLPVSRAMQEARAARIAGGSPAGAWAGLTVLGDGRVVPFPGGVSRPILPLVLSAAAAVVVVAGLGLRARARAKARRGG